MKPDRGTLLAAGMVAAITLLAPATTFAHGPGTAYSSQPCGGHHGSQMGPMMGHGRLGQGQMSMTCPDMMGQGQMGQGQMPMKGRGMMEPGQMGHGGMSMSGQGMMQPLRQDLSAEDVTHMMEHRLAWNGNPNLKLGKVEVKDGDTIVAQIVTQDGSLVQSLEVDRHTGSMRPAQ